MKAYVNWMDNNPLWLQVVLALPILSITWIIYRLLKSLDEGNTVGIVVAILLLLFGWLFLWLIDIITLLLMRKVLWF